MSKKSQVLPSAMLMHFLHGLDNGVVKVDYPDQPRPGSCYFIQKPICSAGGVRFVDAAVEIRALLAENAVLREQVERSIKLHATDCKVTVELGGKVTIEGGNVVMSGAVNMEGAL